MSTGTLTPRGRHHRTAVLALPASPDDGEKASHSRWAAPRAAPVLLALAASYLGCAQLWLELHDRALAAFGADARPRGDFLAETLPYFTDPAVGIVQTPLSFRPPEGRSPAGFTAARARAALWQAMQSCRGRFAAAQSAGSAAVYRRAALTAAGGFAAGSVARGIPAGSLDWGFAAGSVAGGFAAGSAAAEAQTVLGAQAAGYRLVYLPLPLAASLCPATAPTFARQQYRAAADIAAVVFSRRFWQVPLGLLDRLRYLACWSQRLLAGLRVVLLPLAGWAQLLGSLDYLRFRARPASPPRLPLVRRCRSWLAGWNVILAVVWVVLACWRTGQTGSWLAAALVLVGLGYLRVTARLVAELRPASDAPGASGG